MIDIQHDSPVPIHEQIAVQIMAHVAAGALKVGGRLREYRAFAEELLTHPQVVARAYADLEGAGVVRKDRDGDPEVAPGAAAICRTRLQDLARRDLRRAIGKGLAFGLTEADLKETLEQELAADRKKSLAPAEASQAIQTSPHERRHRDSSGIQELPRQKGAGPPEPDRPGGSDIRPARG